ncbi:uncharacterized protein LACBIDRAFT_318696 [Laccaria bicolor S238N-H82]|uniref:Predicted protein n=1 Tax=Laccaria bicolor (strain S238N-H82 / ATCC MYA-4686) TaxID=486041 RepID=B0D6U5_LACBS|nr:uncharacterized protein LACBIDRAFT_318696 [Laccaria bicolor S238N-H82]EDR09536.1 predicted protein [Laccaria bicolor S238N-H82]|eukprot:XP_001879885.1 predicted protein [Laccaria bicolor S238N-H82]
MYKPPYFPNPRLSGCASRYTARPLAIAGEGRVKAARVVGYSLRPKRCGSRNHIIHDLVLNRTECLWLRITLPNCIFSRCVSRYTARPLSMADEDRVKSRLGVGFVRKRIDTLVTHLRPSPESNRISLAEVSICTSNILQMCAPLHY